MASPVLTRELLEQAAPVAARECSRAYLKRVLEKAAHVQIAGVSRQTARGWQAKREPVHDFRVALRRLRAWLRAWRPQLEGNVRRKTLLRLQSIAREASHARDLEVQRATMLARYARSSAAVKAGARWMSARANAEYGPALRGLASTLLRDLGPVAARLLEDLERTPAIAALAGAPVPPPRAAVILAGQLAGHVSALPAQLRRIRSSRHMQAAHEARITIRRFRYALDGISGLTPDVDAAAAYLAGLQDRLGDLHDSHVLEGQLSALIEGAPAADAEVLRWPVAEVRALRTQVRRRIAREYQLVRRVIADRARRRAMDATRRVIRELTKIGVTPAA